MLSVVLDRGREAATRRARGGGGGAAARSGGPRLAPRGEALTPSPSSSSAAARKAAAPVTATHGASVVASTHCELLEVRTEELLRHCPERSLLELAAAAEARGSVREVLRHEITRQRRQQAQRAHFEAMYLSVTRPPRTPPRRRRRRVAAAAVALDAAAAAARPWSWAGDGCVEPCPPPDGRG